MGRVLDATRQRSFPYLGNNCQAHTLHAPNDDAIAIQATLMSTGERPSAVVGVIRLQKLYE